MDKKLLDALNNLSESLDLIAQALSEKSAESPTAKALEGGDFVNQIKEINEGIKKIQSDNQKILKNQETILALSKKKENEKKTEVFQQAGDKNMKDLIKSGVSIVLIIAAGVLAIGMAFKLIGKVDFLSVVGLSIAIVLVAVAFEKIAKLKLDKKDAFNVSITMTLMSAGIVASSWILSMVRPISITQALTAIFISGVFTIISFGLHKIAQGIVLFEKTGVKPEKMILTLVAISASIVASSWILTLIKPISFTQALTAIMIAVMFAAMSYVMPYLAVGLLIVDKLMGNKIWIIPVVFLAISIAISTSSHILALTTPIPFLLLLQIMAMSVILAVSSVVLGIAAAIVSKLGIQNIALGSLSIIIIATTIMISSHLLSLGKYDVYPSMEWSLSTIILMGAFGLLSAGLGALAMSGVGALAMLAGLGMMVVMAATITAISRILAEGDFSYGTNLLPWAKGVSLLYMTFTPIMTFLGAIGLVGAVMSLFGGPDPFEMAKDMMIQIAETIRDVSKRLSEGTYTGGPTSDWAKGISMAIGAFSGVYFKLLDNQSIFSILRGGVDPEDFSNAIKVISEGIVEAGKMFAEAGVSVWKGGPPEEWARGVGMAISAFAPVYKILNDQTLLGSLFGTNVTPEEMNSAMKTISEGIVEVAKYFNNNKVPFTGNYPTKAWGEGVGSAMKGFGDIYEFFNKNKFKKLVKWRPSLLHILDDIMITSGKFTQFKEMGLQWVFPSSKNTKNLVDSVKEWVTMYDSINPRTRSLVSSDIIGKIVNQMMSVAKKIGKSASLFNSKIDPNFIKNLSQNVIAYVALSKFVDSNIQASGGGITGAISSALFGEQSTKNPMDRLVDGMIKLGGAYNLLSKSISNFGNSINGIDAEKLATIRSFTSNVILMSFMDPDAFEDMLEKLEEKAGVFTDIISDMNDASEGKKSISGVKTGGITSTKTDQTQKQMLQILAAMDSKLGTIARNSSTLADYTNELRTSGGVKIKK